MRSAPTARWKGDCDEAANAVAALDPDLVGADGPMERGLRQRDRLLSRAPGEKVGADGPMERGLRPSMQCMPPSPPPSAPTARWKGDCDLFLPCRVSVSQPSVGADGPMERGLRPRALAVPVAPSKLSAPTARWKGDCDTRGITSARLARKVGADGPMERGLRQVPRALPPAGGVQSAPTARWKGDCDPGRFMNDLTHLQSRRRRPDGKGIATCLSHPRDTRSASAPTARWKGDCDSTYSAAHSKSTRSAPTARWKGDCDLSIVPSFNAPNRTVGADGPMERGLRLPISPSGHEIGTSRRRRPDGKGIATSRGALRRQDLQRRRRRRPDGKGIATCRSTHAMRSPFLSAPTARWKGDCDSER